MGWDLFAVCMGRREEMERKEKRLRGGRRRGKENIERREKEGKGKD